jgi:hypothetical protein
MVMISNIEEIRPTESRRQYVPIFTAASKSASFTTDTIPAGNMTGCLVIIKGARTGGSTDFTPYIEHSIEDANFVFVSPPCEPAMGPVVDVMPHIYSLNFAAMLPYWRIAVTLNEPGTYTFTVSIVALYGDFTFGSHVDISSALSSLYNVVVQYSGSNPIYIGESAPGVLKSEASWRIKKISYSGDNPIDIRWADGVSEFTKEWDERASYDYS